MHFKDKVVIVTGGSSGLAKKQQSTYLRMAPSSLLAEKMKPSFGRPPRILAPRIESGLWRETSRTRQPGSLLSKAPSSNLAASISW